MKRSDILEVARSCNFDLYEQVKDLSGNTFFSLRNSSADMEISSPLEVIHWNKQRN